ncbi:MAG: glycosyltransferase [Actinomycetota bacterium]
MAVRKWYAKNTYHHSEFNIRELTYLKNKKDIVISLCFPTLNEEQTIGNILHITKPHIYSLGLVDEVVIIDSNSADNTSDIAKSLGFKVIKHQNILKKYGSFKGKGGSIMGKPVCPQRRYNLLV